MWGTHTPRVKRYYEGTGSGGGGIIDPEILEQRWTDR